MDDLHEVKKADFRQEFGMGLFEANRLFKAIEEEEDSREEENRRKQKKPPRTRFSQPI